MEIKVADVAKLRKMTGAGMMDCKNALVEANGDFERAQEIIREKGKLVAAKRADRETTEGSVVAITNEKKDRGILVCLGVKQILLPKTANFRIWPWELPALPWNVCLTHWKIYLNYLSVKVPLTMP